MREARRDTAVSGKAVRETLAALGVIASLVFVGVEIRQNTTVARANARQALADQSIAVQHAFGADREVAEEALRWMSWEGEPPSSVPSEFPRVLFLLIAALQQRENVFLQAQEGVIGQDALDSYGWGRGALFRSPVFRAYWSSDRELFDPDFVAAFEAEYGLSP